MQPGEHRDTARVLLVNPKNEIFLLKTHFDPEVQLPARWITPGGGIELSETTAEAALRELFEETGLQISESELGDQIWETSGIWAWGDGINSHSYRDFFYQLHISNFDLDTSNWTEDERRDVVEFRWWKLKDLIESGESVGPHELLNFLKNHLV